MNHRESSDGDDGSSGIYMETESERARWGRGVGFGEREEERKKGVTGPNGGYVAV